METKTSLSGDLHPAHQSIGRNGAPIEMKRLAAAEERVVLGEMVRQLEQRGLCLRQGSKSSYRATAGATARQCWSIRRSS